MSTASLQQEVWSPDSRRQRNMPKDASSKNNLISDEESDNVDAKEVSLV